VTEGAMREFFNEFNRSATKKVPASELDEKKRSVVGFDSPYRSKAAERAQLRHHTVKSTGCPRTIGIPTPLRSLL